MKPLFLFILFTLSIFSCNSNNDDSLLNVTIQDIHKGNTVDGNYNPSQHGEVISSQADWDNFRNSHWQYGLSVSQANNINFNNEIVILAFDLLRNTGGYETTINSIVESQNNIVVDISYSGNGDATQKPTRPYHFVKIPKTAKPIVFQ